MTSLLDIGDLRSTVKVRGKELEVAGISAETIFHLLDDIPELRKLLTGAGGEIKPQDLLTKVPGAVSSIIAAGTTPDYYDRPEGDRKMLVQAAKGLSLGEQTDVLKAIWDITFPTGIQTFLDALAELMKASGGASGWAPDTQSPEQLKPSAAEGSPKETAGE